MHRAWALRSERRRRTHQPWLGSTMKAITQSVVTGLRGQESGPPQQRADSRGCTSSGSRACTRVAFPIVLTYPDSRVLGSSWLLGPVEGFEFWQAHRSMGAIYVKQGETYVPMRERPYESEALLQRLLAQHPEMLASTDTRETSLLLIRREAAVADAAEGGGRWSLDHLYVDANGLPTLVEVKRSSDTRGRREVVAQMLDYAANAKLSFGVERIVAWLEEDAQSRGTTVDRLLSEALGVDDPEAFWQTVGVNLDAERFRLIFVSDVIAPELRRIIEFLNSQMTQTEVLAIEVKQYADSAGRQQTIVPRLIGDTAQARQTKRAGDASKRIDRHRLLTGLEQLSQDTAVAAAALLDWAERDPRLEVTWNTTGNIGIRGVRSPLLRLWPDGLLEVRFETLSASETGWGPEQVEDLAQRLNAISGVELGSGRRWPKTALASVGERRCSKTISRCHRYRDWAASADLTSGCIATGAAETTSTYRAGDPLCAPRRRSAGRRQLRPRRLLLAWRSDYVTRAR